MFDPRSRLYRPIPGERVHEPSAVVDRVAGRDRDIEPRTKLPEPRKARSSAVRVLRHSVEPGPYVPKLIRLIRRRFSLSTHHRRATHDIQVDLPKRERAPLGQPMRDVRAELPKPSKLRPTDVHLRPLPRQRPDADSWLSTKGGR